MKGFEKQKIGFIARSDLRDRSNWSGTVAALAKAVASNHEVEPLIIPHDFLEKMARGVDFLLSGGRLRNHGFFCRRYAAYQLNRILSGGGGDILFSPGQSDLLALSVPRDKKLIYLSDAVFRSMIDYYWSGMEPKMEAYLDSAEAKTLERADSVILSSEWAKRDAMRFYHTPEEKIFVIPFGANLRDEYQGKDFATKKNEIKLLLVGVDWERKGIDIAIDALALNSMQSALRFDLTIVGFSKPAGRTFSDAVHFAGQLNKNVPAEYDRMIAYYQASDIFLLPTKAECAGIVFAEAAEYGMPVFSTGRMTTTTRSTATCCRPSFAASTRRRRRVRRA